MLCTLVQFVMAISSVRNLFIKNLSSDGKKWQSIITVLLSLSSGAVMGFCFLVWMLTCLPPLR